MPTNGSSVIANATVKSRPLMLKPKQQGAHIRNLHRQFGCASTIVAQERRKMHPDGRLTRLQRWNWSFHRVLSRRRLRKLGEESMRYNLGRCYRCGDWLGN